MGIRFGAPYRWLRWQLDPNRHRREAEAQRREQMVSLRRRLAYQKRERNRKAS